MAQISKEQVAGSLDSRILELILLPTEKCNFRCTYCYEDFAIGKMPRWVRDAVKRLIQKRSESVELLSLSWFGGEPMAAFDVIDEIAGFATETARQPGSRMHVSGGLTTNGSLLTIDKLDRLAELNQRSFQITLDGDREEHNRTRVRANGKGTFDEIWNNLLNIRDHSEVFEVMLRLHVARDNVDSLSRLLGKINSEFGQSAKFSIHFHRLSDLGGAGGASVFPLGWEEYKQILARLQGDAVIRSGSEASLVDEGAICYAAKPNSLLIRADGRIGKCTVALNDPRNDVGVLQPDGSIQFNTPRLQLWFEGFRDMNSDILACPLSTLAQDRASSTLPVKSRVIESVLA